MLTPEMRTDSDDAYTVADTPFLRRMLSFTDTVMEVWFSPSTMKSLWGALATFTALTQVVRPQSTESSLVVGESTSENTTLIMLPHPQ